MSYHWYFAILIPVIESYNWSLPEGYQRKGTLSIYGDSVSDSLGRYVLSRALCQTLYDGCIVSYQWIYPFINGRQNEDDDLDFRSEIVIENIHKVLNSSKMQREGSLMVLNNGIHFVISLNFTTYQGLVRKLIHSLKKTQEDNRNYTAKIIWRTTTSIRQEIYNKKNTTSWRFFTAQVWKATQPRNPYYRGYGRDRSGLMNDGLNKKMTKEYLAVFVQE